MLGLVLTSIHWRAFIVCVFKLYLDTYYNIVVQYCIIDTRSHDQTTVFLSFFCAVFPSLTTQCFKIFLSNLICYLFHTPSPISLFVVYCCGPVRLRSKHTWSLSLAKTLLLQLQLSPFHFCWTFLWWLKSFYSYFCLIQSVCCCQQECNYSCSWMQQWNSLAIFHWIISLSLFFFFYRCMYYIWLMVLHFNMIPEGYWLCMRSELS